MKLILPGSGSLESNDHQVDIEHTHDSLHVKLTGSQ